MVQIAILGYGVIGSGIVQVLEQNRIHIEKQARHAVTVKRVLDKRDFSAVLGSLYTQDFDSILNDDEIQIIAEVMGGVDPAYGYVKRALLRGKHVCTSNKELVIRHGAELLAIAEERELNFMFEASVGGGIPLVRPINLALTTDEIVAVSGILNGTSNYMLTQMNNFGKSYDEALAGAQELGYAEKDPTADVKGFDACRKLAILLSIATGKQIDYEDILTEGISAIGQADFAFARAFGFTLKHVVDGRISLKGVSALTAPMLVHHQHPLSAVSDVYNGVMVQAKATGSVMFYGPGAGRLPTAGAVISDIVDIAKHLHRHIQFSWVTEKTEILSSAGYITRKLIRISCDDPQNIKELAKDSPAMALAEYPGQVAWITPAETEEATLSGLEGLKVERVLRLYEPLVSDEGKS